MSLSGQHVVRSVGDMHKLAGRVARELVAGDILLLSGELGSGKTTFVQGLARALGVVDNITSPTFTIVGEYEVNGRGVVKKLIHVDLYRLTDRMAIRDPAVVEVLARREMDERVTVIEWADRLVEHRSDGRAERLGALALPGARRFTFQHGATADSRLVTVKL